MLAEVCSTVPEKPFEELQGGFLTSQKAKWHGAFHEPTSLSSSQNSLWQNLPHVPQLLDIDFYHE